MVLMLTQYIFKRQFSKKKLKSTYTKGVWFYGAKLKTYHNILLQSSAFVYKYYNSVSNQISQSTIVLLIYG